MIGVGIRAEAERGPSFYKKDASQAIAGSNTNQVVAEDNKDNKVGADANSDASSNISGKINSNSLGDRESDTLKAELEREAAAKTLESSQKLEEQERAKDEFNKAEEIKREEFRVSGLQKKDKETNGDLPEKKVSSQEITSQEVPTKWTEYVRQQQKNNDLEKSSVISR